MQLEIQNNGPVETTFYVYGDFYNYRSGVYSHVSGLYYGMHAVKVIGWGVSNGVNYWIAQNSWGTSWGESGYFRIKFGEVSFDQTMYACAPDTSSA
jgi:cathepsin B